ncbi:PLP-dependent aminotransferase family protein [Agrobacterium sp. 10MFCol1.1]|uniref:MocR-like pyridoxine biosynthesis transcription factor PdxR n=1 Tax=Agrobacterium sp. 10MFCol1.1 TaxID=1150775 RepID=UPI000378163E|nr:PLP-dependent aminotransferase family protein [Agrobacterium sp. 10MFCol1.1]
MKAAKQFNYPVWTMVLRANSYGPTLQEQLFIQLRRLIVNGQLARGARLPASRSMAKDLGVSRNTVNNAYDRLAAEGYIRRRPSSGFYVEESLPEDSVRPGGERGQIPVTSPVALSARGREASIRHWSWSRQDKFDLSPGMPALDIFPYKQFGRIAANYWRRFAVSDLGYGEGGGLAVLRQQLAIYLSEARGIRCEADQIIVVGSTLQAANLVAQVLLDAGDVVGVEDPAYATLLSTLRSAGLRLAPVPVSSDGLRVDDIARHASDARMILVSPVGQFPAGATMSEQAVEQLLAWANAADRWIFEDDFNSEIRWRGAPIVPLAARRGGERVIHVSSFNRVLAPGLRLAYLVVPRELIAAFTAVQDTLSCYAPLTHQHTVADFMASGELASHLRRTRALYRDRAAAMMTALNEKLGDVFDVPVLDAGLHLTLMAREPFDDVELSRLLRGAWIDTPPLSSYCIERKDVFGLVAGFGNLSVDRVAGAVQRMERVTRRFLEKSANSSDLP